MKKLVLISAMCLAVLLANAQNNKSTTTKTTSKTTSTNTKAKDTTTVSDSVSKTLIKKEDLEKAITENIKKDYPQYNVIRAYKIVNIKKDETTYEILVEKGTQKENIFYDKDGKFLRKEIVKNRFIRQLTNKRNRIIYYYPVFLFKRLLEQAVSFICFNNPFDCKS
jgi:uncharacterized membrane protein